jgi:hypothetical protein
MSPVMWLFVMYIHYDRCKVKQYRYRPEQAQGVDRGIALPCSDLGAKRECGQHHASAVFPG